MPLDVTALIRELRAADERALAEIETSKALGPPAPTIFAFAVEYLEERGAPDSSWPVWGALLAVTVAVCALPNRADHAALIGQLAGFIAQRDKNGCFHAAEILLDLVGPEDEWFVDLAAQSLAAKGKDACPALDPRKAIEALALVGGPHVQDLLLPLAERTSHPLAPGAVLALARLGVTQAEGATIAHLHMKPRLETVEAAGLIRSTEAFAILLDLAEPAAMARRCRAPETGPYWMPVATKALARIGGANAVAPLRALFAALPDGEDTKLVVALVLDELGDEAGTGYVEGQVRTWRDARVFWGKEPLETKWEAANRLAQRGDEEGERLTRRWYGYHDKFVPFTQDTRGVGDRYRVLQALGRYGDGRHLRFLNWAAQTDRQQSEKGWVLAVEAGRATDRIRWRESRELPNTKM